MNDLRLVREDRWNTVLDARIGRKIHKEKLCDFDGETTVVGRFVFEIVCQLQKCSSELSLKQLAMPGVSSFCTWNIADAAGCSGGTQDGEEPAAGRWASWPGGDVSSFFCGRGCMCIYCVTL